MAKFKLRSRSPKSVFRKAGLSGRSAPKAKSLAMKPKRGGYR